MDSSFPGELVLVNLREYGTEIMDREDCRKPLTEFAVRCCTDGIANSADFIARRSHERTLLTPDLLADMFLNYDDAHFSFLYQIYQRDPTKIQKANWNVLIEMALRSKAPELMTLLCAPDADYENEQALVYLTAFDHVEGKKYIYQRMKLYSLILQDAGPEELGEICERFGETDPTLWSDALVKISRAECAPEVLERFLQTVQERHALPFLMVLKVTRAAGRHTFRTLLPLVQATFRDEQELLHQAENRIRDLEAQLKANHDKIQKLSAESFVIQQSKCVGCKEIIDSESSHFVCGHSYHKGCLGDATFCPVCKERVFQPILREKISRLKQPRDEKSVRDALTKAGDGFTFLLTQVSGSLFASGVDQAEAGRNESVLREAEELLQSMTNH
jgi:hypothetical protein